MEPVKKTICDLCAHTPICKNQPQQSCPYLQLKEKKPSPIEPKTQAKPKKSFLHALWVGFLWCVVLICIALAFAAGRFSTRPKYISRVPELPASVKSGITPTELISKFYEYARLHKKDNLIALCHPDLIKQNGYGLTSWINRGPTVLENLQEVTILQAEESITATVSVVKKDRTQTGKTTLKKYNGEWRIFEFSPVF